MKKAVLALACLAVLASAVQAAGPGIKLGVGVFGGLNIPILQADQKSGTEFGIRGRVGLTSFLVAEPNVSFVKWGKPDPVEGVDLGISGSKVTSFGLDVTLGGVPGLPGFKPFGVVGIGSYKFKNDDNPQVDQTKVGYSAGFGLAVRVVPKIDVDVRGKAVVVPWINGGSKKSVSLTAGVGYSL
jgi:opacity protein-like surface antigen